MDDYTDEQIAALQRHGYPILPARGCGGEPSMVIHGRIVDENHNSVPGDLRNRVCYLDGIEIDGHEGSDLDPGCGTCIHCYVCAWKQELNYCPCDDYAEKLRKERE